MNCHECDNFLNHWLDGVTADGSGPINRATTSQPAGLPEHLASCARCREMHLAAGLLQTGLQSLTPPVPPLGMSRRIVARVLAERRSRRLWRYRFVAAAAVAAAVLLTLVPVLNRLLPPASSNVPGPGNEQAKEKTPPPVDAPGKSAPSLKTTVAEAGQALADLTGRLADQTQKQAQLVWSATPTELPVMGSIPGMGADDKNPDPAQQSLQHVTANVTTGLQSVTNTAQQAVNYFSREIPTFGKKAKGS